MVQTAYAEAALIEYRHIIWDWNGTILDDVWLSHALCCAEIEARGYPRLEREEYVRRFRLPVRQFYEDIGVDLTRHSYPELASSFHAKYEARFGECALFPDVAAALGIFGDWGLSQSVLSALPHVLLEEHVAQHGLAPLFADIRGLDSNHADSKVANGHAWMARQHFTPRDVLFIGDTDHDAEVAAALGTDCALIARGYQHAEVLALSGHVFSSAAELVEHLRQHGRLNGKGGV